MYLLVSKRVSVIIGSGRSLTTIRYHELFDRPFKFTQRKTREQTVSFFFSLARDRRKISVRIDGKYIVLAINLHIRGGRGRAFEQIRI